MADSTKKWRRMNRERQPFERRFTRVFAKALAVQAVPVIVQMQKDYTQVDDRIRNLSEEPIEKAYVSTYTITSTWFALNYYSTFTAETVPVEGIESIFEAAFRKYARTEAGAYIKEVTQTSKEEMRRIIGPILEETLDEGLGAEETARRIEKRFASQYKEISRARARTIARTEVVRASNLGVHKAVTASGVPHVKSWLTGGSNIRASHLEAQGNDANIGIPIDQDFIVGDGELAQWPNDPRLSAKESVNCKCIADYTII